MNILHLCKTIQPTSTDQTRQSNSFKDSLTHAYRIQSVKFRIKYVVVIYVRILPPCIRHQYENIKQLLNVNSFQCLHISKLFSVIHIDLVSVCPGFCHHHKFFFVIVFFFSFCVRLGMCARFFPPAFLFFNHSKLT